MNRLLYLFILIISQLVLSAQAGWAVGSPLPLQPADEDETTYTLTLNTSPANAGSFNRSSGGKFSAGQNVYMYYYTNEDYWFEYWQSGDTVVSRDRFFYFTMPDHDATLTAVFRYGPGNPGDPQSPDQTRKYTLTLNTEPANAGSFSYSSGEQFTGGQSLWLYAYANDGFVFDRWQQGDSTMSDSRGFDFTMPYSDAALTAVYHYDPTSPADPDTPKVYYNVILETQPANAGSFNWNSETRVVAGSDYYVYAYTNSDYTFREWVLDGEIVGTDRQYNFTMPSKDIRLVALYDYTPANPGNPGKNYWNAETGEVIVDDFEAGNLSSAIYNTVSGNYDQVQMMTVAGPVSQYDWGVVNNYSNCTLLDMSRTYGMTYVPSWNFSGNSVLTNIVLPAGIEKIDYYAFQNCSSLSSISIYAPTPPTIGIRAFEGIADSIVYVPADAMSLYQEAEGWKDFTILPLAKEVSALEVNIPDGTDPSVYKDMYIELINTKSGQKQRFVITNRLTYTFNSLVHRTSYNVYLKNAQGDVLGEVDGIDIVDKDVSVTFSELKVPRALTLSVLDANGQDVTEQTTVTWFDAKDTWLAKGSTLDGQIEGANVKFHVVLPQSLAMLYQIPADSVYEVKTDNAISVSLNAIPQLTIGGKVIDVKTGKALGGATIAISQTLNGLYSKVFTTKTDNDGAWSQMVYEASTDITASMTDYVSKTQSFDTLVAEIPGFELKDISGTTIKLNLTYTSVDGEAQYFYSDYANVAFTVFNRTTQQEVADINVQYPQIVLMESLPEGTEVSVTATSKNAKFMPVTATATVDLLDCATVTLPIVQLGGISATFKQTENNSITGILYDSNGRLVRKYDYSGASLTISELTDGAYTLVTMANSQFFNSVASVSQFAEAGLREGIDYVKNSVTVKSGETAIVENALIPYLDETRLYYTGDNTSVSVNKSQITVGNYLTMSSRLDFKSAFANSVSDVKLIVDLPEETSFVENSVMAGSSTASYTYENHKLTIPLANYSDRVRFCFIPTAGGELVATASVQFTLRGQEITQPIGNASFTSKNLSISVPSVVAKGTVPVSGTAPGKSTVKIYADDVFVGQTTSLANGSWLTVIDIGEPENLSEHSIYAKVETSQGLEMTSETKSCLYDMSAVEAKSVKMSFYNGWLRQNVEVVFDLENGRSSETSYMFYSRTDITFLIDLSYHDVKLIPFVWLHVFTSDGKFRSLRADYDEKKDRWIAVDKFSSEALPTRVSVTVENMIFDPSSDSAYETLIDQYVGDISLKETIEEADGSSTSNYTDSNGEDIASVTSYESDLTADQLVESFKQEGYEEDELLDDMSDYVPEGEDDILNDNIKVLTEPNSGSLVLIAPGTSGKTKVVIIRIVREEDKQSSTSLVSSMITREWKSFFKSYFDEVNCTQVIVYKKYQEHLDKYVTIITSTLVAHTIFVDYRLLPPGTKIPGKQVIARLKRIRHSSKRYTTWTLEYSVVPKSCPPPKPPTPPIPPLPPVNPILDPSGYVYEAVSSNRLQGVTATVYYKEIVEDMYGDLHENIVLWDAEEYAQENPLFTDEYGMYQWDVPQGLWRVKFEKEGYQTTYSEWLPVPPPQLDVNIAMTQMLQPTVKSGKAYSEGVEMEFDKYMDPATLTTGNIMVTKNGTAISGTIELLNEEVSYEGQEETFASKVRFTVPEGEELLATDEVQLTVKKAVKSYAGVQMQDDYTQKFDVEPVIRAISADSLINVGYGYDRTITLAALPADASKGKTIRVQSLSPMIATVSSETLTLDENGQAELKVSGELPGSTSLSYSFDDSDVKGMTMVNVKDVEKLVTVAPKASRVSGTEVYRGTKVQLSSETDGAVIYYTLDGTCPCDSETAIKYDSDAPIVINDDNVTIKAIAQGTDLAESEVSEFNYSLRTTTVGYTLPEGWTWISHNEEEAIPATAFQTGAERIVSQTQELINDPVAGFIGNLTELEPAVGYKVKQSAENTVRLSGYEWNASQQAVPVESGWNWIGYPVNQTMTLDEALAFFSPTEGDFIVGQNGYAEYADGEWKGTLEGMKPGEGFLYKSAKAAEIVFNTTIVSSANSRLYKHLTLKNSPWAANPRAYSNVMPMTAQLCDNGNSVTDGEYVVGAFAGTECRGIGQWKEGRLLMSIYGTGGEDLDFVAYEPQTGQMFNINETLKFEADNLGTWHQPYSLTVGGPATDLGRNHLDNTIHVTPIVARDHITVTAGGKEISYFSLTDMSGRTVTALSNLGTGATVTTSSLAEGVYILTVKADDETFYFKIVKSNK